MHFHWSNLSLVHSTRELCTKLYQAFSNWPTELFLVFCSYSLSFNLLLYIIPPRELFNAAFVSCWMELRPVHQEDMVSNLKQALSQHNIPEITQTMLNLAEFMEHCEEATVSRVSCGVM